MKKRIAFYGILIFAALGVKMYLDSGACKVEKQFSETQERVSMIAEEMSKTLGTKAAVDQKGEQMGWLICLPF